jgi:hypothetical protein
MPLWVDQLVRGWSLQTIAEEWTYASVIYWVQELVRSPGVLLALAMYGGVLPLAGPLLGDGSHYRQHRSAWKAVMYLYNVVMSVYSATTAIGLGVELWFHPPSCDPTVRMDNTWIQLFYYSKYVEFADTFFLYVMGKRPIFLQTFHHAGAVLVMWSSQHIGAIWAFVVFNGTIHAFMYAYYAASTMGRSFFLPKMALTTMQMMQFVGGVAASTQYINYDAHDSHALVARFAARTTQVYVLTLLGLFAHFSWNTYVRRPSPTSDRSHTE